MKKTLRQKITGFLQKNDSLFSTLRYLRLRYIMFAYKHMSDEEYIKKQYEKRLGRKLNLEQPVLYNEKVQYAKLYQRDERMKLLVDKYEVRKYVSQNIGEAYLTKLYGVYESVDDIDFSALPDRFVMKLTNGSGFNYICKEKTDKEIRKIKRRFRNWMKLDFYMLGREWAYKDMKNRIICEEYLDCDEPYGLNDYKVFCFDGVPEVIQVDYARFTAHKRNLYTPDWTFIDEKMAYENDANALISRPERLEDMLSCARKLSSGFPHVRVDFFSIGSRIVFGEMTFYHGAGYLRFSSREFEQKMGENWRLS